MPTSFVQNLKFQSVPEERVDEFDFVGGLVTDAHETKLQPNQSPDLANVIFNQTGSIKTRNGYTRYNGTPIGASSDQSNTGAASGDLATTTPTGYIAQTFQPSGAISVVQIDLYLEMTNSGEQQNVRVELWSTSGGAPSALLIDGQSQILLVSGTSETTYSFRFREPISLSASTTYAIVLKPYVSSTSQSINSIEANYTGSAYANGSVYTSTNSGMNWTVDTAKDLKFVVYAGGNTGGTGLLRFYTSTGIKRLIAKVGTSLYRGNDSTGAMTSMSLGSGASLVAANFIDWTISNNTLLVVDGSNRIQKYRGSTNSNYTTGTVSVTNGSATITGSGTSWSTTTNAEVGEYIQLPDSKWYKITAIASNTSLTIEISYQGSTVSGQSYVIAAWGEVQGKLGTATAVTSLVRPTPKFIENHLNRIWTLDGNTLRWSVLDTSVTEENFNDWDSSNNAGAVIIPSGQGDTGTGLYSLGGTLYVFQRRAIWGLYGNSPGNFQLKNITNEVGMLDKRTLVEWGDVLAFLSDLGVILFDGTNILNVSDGVVNTSINDWANKSTPVATLWENKYILAYTPSGGSYNSEAIFYDFTRKVFGKVEGLFANAWSRWSGGNDTGQIYFVSSNQGSIYRWDIGGSDDGYEITTRYSTPSLSFGAGINDKTVKKMYLQQLALGDWDVGVTQLTDMGETTITSSVNLSPGTTALWDVAQWDTDTWSSEGTLVTSRIAEFQGLAKYYRYLFEQTGYNQGMEALGVTVTARVRRLT